MCLARIVFVGVLDIHRILNLDIVNETLSFDSLEICSTVWIK